MSGNDVMVPYLGPEVMEALDKPDSDIYSLTWFMNYKKIE